MVRGTSYKWEAGTFFEARYKKPVRTNLARVREAIAILKALARKEQDPTVRDHLAKAGIELSKILLNI